VYHIRSWHREQQQKSQGNNDGTPLDIVAIGGLGGRVDQALSQIHHLYLFQAGGVEEDDEEGHVPAEQRSTYDAGRVYLVSSHSLTFLLRRGRHRIRVQEVGEAEAGIPSVFGKHVGILPIGEPSRITTRGLEWDVTDWLTRFGGRVSTSNHILPETEVVEVETTRDVVWTMALNRVEVG
jgi:thiamine pyrophosphokinase